jgi:hypothetical protein
LAKTPISENQSLPGRLGWHQIVAGCSIT